jgi:uncharacterized protein (DUF362 family)
MAWEWRNTAPEVVGAILDVLRARGAAEIVVGEGPGFRRDAGPVVEHSGLAAVLARRGIPFIDLNHIEHLHWGIWAGVGQGVHIEVRGAALEALRRRYQRPPK